MKRFVKSLVLALGFVGGCTAAEMTEKERWDFVQEKFIAEPGKTFVGWFSEHSSELSLGTFIIVGMLVYPYFIYPKLVFPVVGTMRSMFQPTGGGSDEVKCRLKAQIEKKFNHVYRGCAVSAYLLALLVPSKIIKYFKGNLDYSVFENYVDHWEEYRDKTPEVLREQFERIYSKYKTSAEPEEYLKTVAMEFIGAVVKLSAGYSQLSSQQNS